jgi:hypothetical protein
MCGLASNMTECQIFLIYPLHEDIRPEASGFMLILHTSEHEGPTCSHLVTLTSLSQRAVQESEVIKISVGVYFIIAGSFNRQVHG